jgi:hypothetical protein
MNNTKFGNDLNLHIILFLITFCSPRKAFTYFKGFMTKKGNFKNNVGTCCNLFFVAQQPKLGLSRLIVDVPRSHPPGRIPLNEWSVRRRGHPTRQITNTREEHLCHERDVIPRSQQSSSFRHSHLTTRQRGSTCAVITCVNLGTVHLNGLRSLRLSIFLIHSP